jgi:hypothetical protein
MRVVVASVLAAVFLSGCAQDPKDIAPSYVSPMAYQGYTCEQIGQEAQRVSDRAVQLTGTQAQKATNDKIAMGVSLIVFWPAVFLIKGDKETAAELARLRGELDALDQASIAKHCGLTIKTYQ